MVELKTSMAIRSPRDEARFDKCAFKLLIYPSTVLITKTENYSSFTFNPSSSAYPYPTRSFFLISFIPNFLYNHKEIVVGFRTPQGHLTALQSLRTLSIPRSVRGKPGAWDAQLCLVWGARFLEWLREQCRADDVGDGNGGARTVWRVSFTPGTDVALRRLGGDDVRDVVHGEDRVGFLPMWYWDELHGHKNEKSTKAARGSDASESDASVGWKI